MSRAPVIYEVTAACTPEVADAYGAFLQATHIADVLATGCFVRATMDRDGAHTFRIRYEATDDAAVARYLSLHAPRLRGDVTARFPEGVTLTRAEWHRVAAWPEEGAGERLAGALRRTLHGPMWHGPALLELLRDLTAEDAARRPVTGAHSVWDLVLHVAAWAEVARVRLGGRAWEPSLEEDWPRHGTPTAAAWVAAKQRLTAAYEALAAAAAQATPAQLAATVPGASYDAATMLQGVVEHGAYHGGQVALLRRATGLLP